VKLYRATYEKMKDLLPYRAFPRVRDHLGSLPHGDVCPRNVSWVTIEGVLVQNVSWPSWSPAADGLSANCHRVDSFSNEASFIVYEDGDMDSMCYACICAVSSENVQESDYCELYRNDKSTAGSWGLLATVLVVVVNQILKQSIVFSAPQIRSHTKEEELRLKVLRIFMCQLTNTAILVLLTKSDLGPFSDLPGEHYKTMNAKWYANIAAPMCLTMLIQFVTPPAFHFIFHYGVGTVLRCVGRRSAKTQNQLNAAEAPKPRDYAAGYGEILLAMSVTLIYGPGVPVLYFVAVFGFTLRFVVEKWFDLRIYEKPPLYSKELLNSFDEVLSIILVLHTGFSLYLISVAGGSQPSADTDFDLSRPHVAPMIVAFIFTCICFILKVVTLHGGCKFFVRTNLPGGSYCLYDDSHKGEDLPKFSEVYERDLLGNEDDDYIMDDKEELRDMQLMFARELRKQHSTGQFEDEQLYRRLLACVEDTGCAASNANLQVQLPDAPTMQP
jgi:hypothetical protein